MPRGVVVVRSLTQCADALLLTSPTHILAIDAARKTGWAILTLDGDLVDSGVIRLRTKDAAMLDEFQASLSSACRGAGVSRDAVIVAYETPFRHHKARSNPGFGWRLEAALWLWCRDHGAPFIGIAPGELKKHATGKGNARKPAMKAAAAERFPEATILDDNHADALLVGAWAASEVTTERQGRVS